MNETKPSPPKPPPNRVIREGDTGPKCAVCKSSLYKEHWWSRRTSNCISSKCTNYVGKYISYIKVKKSMSQEVIHKHLPKEQHDKVVVFLQNYLSEKVKIQIRNAVKKNPEKWWAKHHFHWGMNIRNILRENGFGEKELGIENLDDYYISLVEEAVQ